MITIEKVKLLLDRPELSEDLIQLFIDRAEADIRGFCNIDELPEEVEAAVCELAVLYFSKRGLDGVSNYSEGGISYGFEKGIPENVKSRLRPFVKGRVTAI